jgi:hypothetical protein
MAERSEVPSIPSTVRGRKARSLWRYYAPDWSRNYKITPASEPLLVNFCNKIAEFKQCLEDGEPFNLREWEELRRVMKPLGIWI